MNLWKEKIFMHKATYGAIKQRIHILEERTDKENQAIIRKLRRKLRQMEKEKHNYVISEGI